MMVINNNIPALNAYDVVNNTSNQLQKSIQKLSTGLRINSASDDAAGLSISEKMRAQINGLDQAVRNTQDGISLIQTAEGALTETHSILQRMRELSVQAANDTYTAQDRSYIQEEVDLLREEIDHIGNTTTFNTKKLLNGDAGAVWSSDNINTSALIRGGLRTIDQFGQKSSAEGNYKITVKSTAGDGQVQKSSILRIKHDVNGWNATANTDIGIAASSSQTSPTISKAGKYTVAGEVLKNGDATQDATAQVVSDNSDATLAVNLGTHTGTATGTGTGNANTKDVLNNNYNIVLTVDSVDSANGVVNFKVTGSKIDKTGTSAALDSNEVHDTFSLSSAESKKLHLEGYNGVTFDQLTSLSGFEEGDQFVVNVSATAEAGDSIVSVSDGKYNAGTVAAGDNMNTHKFTVNNSDIAGNTATFQVYTAEDPATAGEISVTTDADFDSKAQTGEWVVYTKLVEDSEEPTALNYSYRASAWTGTDDGETDAEDTASSDGWNTAIVKTTGSSVDGISTNNPDSKITVTASAITDATTAGTINSLRKEYQTEVNGETVTKSETISASSDNLMKNFSVNTADHLGVVNGVTKFTITELVTSDTLASNTITLSYETNGTSNDGSAVHNTGTITLAANGTNAVATDVGSGSNLVGRFSIAAFSGTGGAANAKSTYEGFGKVGDSFTITTTANLADTGTAFTVADSENSFDSMTYNIVNSAITNSASLAFKVPVTNTGIQSLEDNTSITTASKDLGTVTIATNIAGTDLNTALGTSGDQVIATFEVGAAATGTASTLDATGGLKTTSLSDSSSVGEVAVKENKLYDLEQFWDSQGVFMLEDPQTITITQGDGKTASVTLYANDTIDNVVDKLNSAIANDLGQAAYVDDATKFVTYVDPDENTEETSEAVEGTMLVRSAVAGNKGTLTFSSKSEDLINALGLNVIQKATESTYEVTVQDAHTGDIVNGIENEKITGNVLVGRLHQNVDVEFDPTTGIKAAWDDTNKKFTLTGSSDVTYLHLSDNTVVFQIGANEGDDMGVNIGDMRSHALGLDGVLVTNRDAASRSITLIDSAIDKVSTQRAKLGAYQNRLEHTAANLTTSAENLTAAESRIRDADMAKEMMNFTKLQIMLQAGNSMLAQANQLPQNVLSLIR